MATTRRLAAILAADVVGYSRLMGADEEGTHSRLKWLHAEFIEPAIAAHHGRIFKTTGDGLLAEFASVVEAVRCAVAMQRVIGERDAAMATESRLGLRIGVHVGDVIIDGDDIFGDGVNIAARLEALAEPGGICVSALVHEDAAGKVEADFKDIGEQALKNIDRPVRVYKVLSAKVRDTARADVPPNIERAVASTLRKIGYLGIGPGPDYEEFKRALVSYAYIDGSTVSVLARWNGGAHDKNTELAAELIDLEPEVILASSSPAVVALKQATRTIPIVMVEVGDPVGYGIVPSLMRPAGNITGMSNAMYEFMPRSVRVLKEIVAGAVRVAILAPQNNPGMNLGVKAVEDVAHALDMVSRTYIATTTDDIRLVLADIDRRNCDVLYVLPDYGLMRSRALILETAARVGFPVISAAPEYVRDGALLSLGPNRIEIHRRAAHYVDAILKGTPPSALAIEEASKSWLALNLRTAQSLGIAIPPPILMRADEVIE